MLEHDPARLGRDKVEDVHAGELGVGVVAEELGEGSVGLQHPPHLGDRDPFERGVREGAKALLALAQRHLALLELGVLGGQPPVHDDPQEGEA
ncbi:MAG: hypothetical protein M3R38_16130 [Actinomycetota bacterium]|nr:hypothetical protein [Actinomycetota bacterium]